ncbi:S-adenosyl-L-methionine-dependent methyltransferase, partial [Gorgonomyces haynaldii]
EHKNGEFLFQSLSSMIPPLCLDIPDGAKVLDMCAAPGGKSLQLVESNPNGLTVCNEIDLHRFDHLTRNLEKWVPQSNRQTYETRRSDARKLLDVYGKAFFDCILLDAPCSGEGTFHASHMPAIKHWSPNLVLKNQKLQQQLLEAAFHLLKPGGQLVYSTCTLLKPENEDNVDWFLNQFPVQLETIPMDFSQTSFHPGLPSHRDLSKTLRIDPSNHYQGFFVARFR